MFCITLCINFNDYEPEYECSESNTNLTDGNIQEEVIDNMDRREIIFEEITEIRDISDKA